MKLNQIEFMQFQIAFIKLDIAKNWLNLQSKILN